MFISWKSLKLIDFLNNVLGFSVFSDIMRRDRVAPCSGKLGCVCYDEIMIIQHVAFLIMFFSQWREQEYMYAYCGSFASW